MQDQQQMGMTPTTEQEGVYRRDAVRTSQVQQGQNDKPAQQGQKITDWASI